MQALSRSVWVQQSFLRLAVQQSLLFQRDLLGSQFKELRFELELYLFSADFQLLGYIHIAYPRKCVSLRQKKRRKVLFVPMYLCDILRVDGHFKRLLLIIVHLQLM
jgi:hypothetical protein